MLSVVMADRPEDLLDDLVEGLSSPADPFVADWVSVPSMGFRNWLRQQLSLRLGSSGSDDGIAANIELPFPGALRWVILDAHRSHTGGADVPDPWQVDRLVWTVLDVLADPPGDIDPRLSSGAKGVPLAGRAGPIADLFDRYMIHRPEMVLSWADGRDVGPDGAPLEPSDRWQSQLYRTVKDRIAERHGVELSPAERLIDALDMLRSGELALDATGEASLPARLFLFGQSLLTAELGPVLDALSVHRDVTALLLSPSARESLRCAESVAADGAPRSGSTVSWAFARSDALAVPRSEHPLLATWGQRPLESAMLLGAGGVTPTCRAVDEAPPATLLERLQSDLRRGVLEDQPFDVSAHDHSVQVHAAPGRTRQVEALRDALLALLRDSPDLAESDIAIVCPQLEQFAPVLTGVLGPSAQRNEQTERGSLPCLRYTVVDRSARSFNPVLDAMATLLELLPGRFDVTSVSGLLASTAVRERFGLSAQDLALLSDWTDASRVRWGLDGRQRLAWNVGSDIDANSWTSGVDQLMMGVALGDDLRNVTVPGSSANPATYVVDPLAIGGIAPVPLSDGDLGGAGRLAAAVRSLARAHELLVAPGARSIDSWATDLIRVADLMVAPMRFEEWQRTRFDEVVDALVAASRGEDGEPSDVLLEFADIRRLLAPSLSGSRSRADLGFGSIVVARPALVASVPFRVVCVLGLDADALPVGRSDGDDLLTHAPVIGDRDLRAEARAELLASLTAARETLIVTCTSRSVRNNALVPEAVALDELYELIARTVGVSPDELREGAAGVVVTHPRQAFDPRNFVAEEGRQPAGFDPVARDGAAALCHLEREQSPAPTVFLAEPLAEVGDQLEPVELEDLRWFFTHPVRSFFRSRLNVVVPTRADASDDDLPTALSNLDIALVGSELLHVGLTLATPGDVLVDPLTGAVDPLVGDVVAAFRSRGVLPPPSIANSAVATVSEEVAALLECAETLQVRRAALDAHSIDAVLPDSTRLVGSVSGCLDGSLQGPVRLRFSRTKPNHRMSLALDLLALTLMDPSCDWRAVFIGRGASSKQPGPVVVSQRVAGSNATERHAAASQAVSLLIQQYREGLRFPLPLFDATSWAMHHDQRPADAWGDPVSGGDYKECNDPYHVRAFGAIKYYDLVRLSPGGYTPAGEAERLWGTLDEALVHEDVEEAG